jgi:hypothetical protein
MRRSLHALRHAVRAAAPAARALGVLGLIGALALPARAQVVIDPNPTPLPPPFSGFHVTTHRYNNQRTGVNANETFLTPNIVKNGFITPTGTRQVFGKMFSRNLDADVFAQPLYVSNVPTVDPFTQIAALRNVVYVCTTNNTIYAYDADSTKGNFSRPYWQRNFNYPLIDILPVPSLDIFPNYFDISPIIGIVGTPVIDVASQTMYVVVRTKDFGEYIQRLYALDLATGQDVAGPVNITATIEGNSYDSIPDPNDDTQSVVNFETRMQNQQAALLLANGLLYIAWGSHADLPDYHGWILAYDPTTLQQVAAFNTTRDAPFDPDNPVGGGIWMGGSGIATDDAGNLYVSTGNGTFDADLGNRNFGTSILKLRPDLTLYDFFTPFNHPFLTENRMDLGAGGVVVLPPSVGNGAHPNLLIAGGLEGRLYLLDRTDKADPNEIRMGGFTIGSDAVVQSFRNAVGPIYGAPAYFNGRLYYNSAGDVLKQFLISGGNLNPITEHRSTTRLGFPGASPIVSANGTQNGIVWTVGPYYPPPIIPGAQEPPPKAILYAHDANDVSQKLYDGLALGETDVAGQYTNHTVPVVANGKVYVAANKQLTTYGVAPPSRSTIPRASRYLITGPNLMPAFGILPVITQKISYSFQITAIGVNQQPMRLTTTAQLTLREPSGSLRQLATLRYENQSTLIHSRAFPVPGLYELIVTDTNGTTGSTLILVNFFSTEDQDRYTIRMKSTGRRGELIPLTVTAVTATGAPVSVFDIDTQNNLFIPRGFAIYSTDPAGSQDLDFLSPGFAYDLDHPDPLGNAPQLFFESQVTVLVRLRNTGKQVFIVTDGAHTGTAVIDVRP